MATGNINVHAIGRAIVVAEVTEIDDPHRRRLTTSIHYDIL
jgi:hypothetical protein